MPVVWLRSGLLACVLLSLGVIANLLAMQGGGERARSGKQRQEHGTAAAASAASPAAEPGSGGMARPAGSPSPRAAAPSPPGESPETIRAIQRELQARGYESGAADGVPGIVTRAAIMAYEHDNGMPVLGAADVALLKAVLLGSANAGASPAT